MVISLFRKLGTAQPRRAQALQETERIPADGHGRKKRLQRDAGHLHNQRLRGHNDVLHQEVQIPQEETRRVGNGHGRQPRDDDPQRKTQEQEEEEGRISYGVQQPQAQAQETRRGLRAAQ